MKPIFAMLAAYNAWSNERLHEAAAQLSDADYRADRGAFFKSVHGTLNHILVVDRIWMKRFTGQGDAPNRLDAILFDRLGDLRQARRQEDARIGAYIESLSEADLTGQLQYLTIVNPVSVTQPLPSALLHFFNHQTHHRGQAHCLLTGFGVDAPSLDIIMFQRATGIGMA